MSIASGRPRPTGLRHGWRAGINAFCGGAFCKRCGHQRDAWLYENAFGERTARIIARVQVTFLMATCESIWRLMGLVFEFLSDGSRSNTHPDNRTQESPPLLGLGPYNYRPGLGVFFGRLIRLLLVVSAGFWPMLQRSSLTRNPAGWRGALKKILITAPELIFATKCRRSQTTSFIIANGLDFNRSLFATHPC